MLHEKPKRAPTRAEEITNMKRILPLMAAAKQLHVHHQTIRRWIREGKIRKPFYFVEGGHPYFTKEYLDHLIAERIAASGDTPEAA